MAEYAFSPPAQVSLPILGSDSRFPVRRVYCIGRNYADHAREMGHDPDREPPFFFQKNPDNLDPSGTFPYPDKTSDVHHEVELAVMLSSGGTNVPVDAAEACIFGYALALDMTRRDLQGAQKKMGRPWEIGKAFERSAPVGPIHPIAATGTLNAGRIWAEVNGELRQDGDLNQMIWKVPEMISYLSEYFELAAGDVILSGTPAGVGPVERGGRIEIGVEALGTMVVDVV